MVREYRRRCNTVENIHKVIGSLAYVAGGIREGASGRTIIFPRTTSPLVFTALFTDGFATKTEALAPEIQLATQAIGS